MKKSGKALVNWFSKESKELLDLIIESSSLVNLGVENWLTLDLLESLLVAKFKLSRRFLKLLLRCSIYVAVLNNSSSLFLSSVSINSLSKAKRLFFSFWKLNLTLKEIKKTENKIRVMINPKLNNNNLTADRLFPSAFLLVKDWSLG